MVCGNSPARPGAEPVADRRRVDSTGIDRGQEPLGPHAATTSFSVTTSPHAPQVSSGAKEASHVAWCIAGRSSAWTGTHRRSHSQIEVSTGHSEPPRGVSTYS